MLKEHEFHDLLANLRYGHGEGMEDLDELMEKAADTIEDLNDKIDSLYNEIRHLETLPYLD